MDGVIVDAMTKPGCVGVVDGAIGGYVRRT